MRTFLFFHDNDVNLITVNLLSWNLYLREGVFDQDFTVKEICGQ